MLKLLRVVSMVMLVVAMLSGCATGYLLDNSVQSFSSLAALPSQPSYRLERLPSQQAFPLQTQVEAMADPALFKAGLRRDDAAPQFSVQVTARVHRALSPWADPWDRWGGVGGWGGGGRGRWGGGFGGPFPRIDQPWFHREVAIVMRDLSSNRVVYETQAVNDGPWGDNVSVFPAMFDAALRGFPNPPAGVRLVSIQVGSN